MQLNIEPISYEHAKECILLKIDNLTLSHPDFSTWSVYTSTQEEIASLCKMKGNTKIWIKINAFIHEGQIADLTKYLVWLNQQKVDFVIFQDYAIAEIVHDLKLSLKLHYNPDTLVTNYGQFNFFIANNFSGCFLARELMQNEILEMGEHKQNLALEIQAFGYGFIMHSRWKLISNFDDFYNVNISPSTEAIKIKENLRKIPNLIYEDKQGTHMLTGYVISVLSVLDKLVKSVDYLTMNFLQIEASKVDAIIDVYKVAIKDLNCGKYNSEKYIKLMQNILPETLISAGFLGGPKDILHLLKEENE